MKRILQELVLTADKENLMKMIDLILEMLDNQIDDKLYITEKVIASESKEKALKENKKLQELIKKKKEILSFKSELNETSRSELHDLREMVVRTKENENMSIEDFCNVNGEKIVVREREEEKPEKEINSKTFTLSEVNGIPPIQGYKLLDNPEKLAGNAAMLFTYICKELYSMDKEKLIRLKNDRRFMANTGRRYFAEDNANLKNGKKVAENFWVETQFKKIQIKDYIVKLLEEYNIDVDKLVLYKK
jgi:D-ribose pyranose/furanose isomerase RbsD